eukprot:m.195513 g.195513  ORF g.195513 m.195513 type:complete len:589 (+) comp19506_c0_seq1:342-2108(+)
MKTSALTPTPALTRGLHQHRVMNQRDLRGSLRVVPCPTTRMILIVMAITAMPAMCTVPVVRTATDSTSMYMYTQPAPPDVSCHARDGNADCHTDDHYNTGDVGAAHAAHASHRAEYPDLATTPQALTAASSAHLIQSATAHLDRAERARALGATPLVVGRIAREAGAILDEVERRAATRMGDRDMAGLKAWSPLSSFLWYRFLVMTAHEASAKGNVPEAVQALKTAISILERSPPKTLSPADGRPIEMEIIATLVDLSTQESLAREHDDALKTLDHLELYQPKGDTAQTHFSKVVALQRGKVLRCANRLNEAAASYRRALENARRLDDFDDPATAHQLGTRMNELVEVLNWQGKTTEAGKVASAAADIMGWPSAVQRPVHRHVHGLRSAPWLDLASFPTVGRLADSLVEFSEALKTESIELIQKGAFRMQSECLHDPDRGSWGYVAVVGDADPTWCEVAVAPAACKWLETARTLDGVASIVRVGYSLVEPSAWIRPHTGVDNTQLKLHLGLHVPTASPRVDTSDSDVDVNSNRCATFIVAGVAGGWKQDGVIFFDDTFEHEVWNNCSEARVVLQVVIRHPDITGQESK